MKRHHNHSDHHKPTVKPHLSRRQKNIVHTVLAAMIALGLFLGPYAIVDWLFLVAVIVEVF